MVILNLLADLYYSSQVFVWLGPNLFKAGHQKVWWESLMAVSVVVLDWKQCDLCVLSRCSVSGPER